MKKPSFGFVVGAVQSACIVVLIAVNISSMSTSRSAIAAAQRWESISEQWESNSNAFEVVAARNLKTATSCLALLEARQ